jgi:hypothetical protein
MSDNIEAAQNHEPKLHPVVRGNRPRKRQRRIEADQWGLLPREYVRRDPEWRLASAFHDLYKFINSTRDAGGIEKLANTWSPECRARYLQEIRNIIAVLQRWASSAEVDNKPNKKYGLHFTPRQVRSGAAVMKQRA